MCKLASKYLCLLILGVGGLTANAQDKIKLETITIKGNKELPKILYVVPWQEAEKSKQKKQKLKLHRFFGELYEPLIIAPPKTAFD